MDIKLRWEDNSGKFTAVPRSCRGIVGAAAVMIRFSVNTGGWTRITPQDQSRLACWAIREFKA
ncbi:hypothetical protein PAAG_12031 [Paracoccidioides lutzii Pb01]|uniref:Uncharacterized protein n=1 Tax=Paracoccidioides lutzii (strain ATCC MYA-826 / Pb01) TaxID=502779 RepID=A0A0A2V552_PARBA|nr:hypothetical protein PAAG_12031 [Paracoccidioides lutzii Pb01]KGQ01260.1 hypothetical protein PAAG_12031 [Paracoccidioides lutzii Pb01]